MPDDLGRAIDLIVDQVSQRLTTRPPTTGLAHVWRAGLSYAEGQTVRYMGGMWQAQCETRAPPGTPGEWLLLCDGIRRMIAATPGPDEDPRHYAIIAMLSSGIDIELPFLLPLPVNRGAFQHGVDYRLGDEVEHGGSTFRATRDDPGVPPNERWQLIAARGHTGEQGPCGIQGERGDIGPRGLQGERGDKGERGGVGERGERGQTGETGPRGADLRDWELVRIGPRMMLRMEMSDGALSDPVPWPSMQFVGVYQPGERYQRGDVVRFGFVLWIATVDTEAVPTINTDDWEVLLPGVDPSGTGGGGGGGSNLPTLDARYLQLIGGQMTGTIAFDRDQLGLLWIGANAAVYNDAQGLILRRGLFDPPVWVENNDGLPASRRRILTEDDLPGLGGFLPLSGGLMTGTIGFDGSNLGLHWDNEAAMYLSSDGLILRRDAADNPVQIEAGAGTLASRRPILTTDTGVLKAGDTMSGDLTLAGDPTADLHAVPRRYLHGNFLPLDGGQMRGQVIATQGSLGAPGLAIGSGDTGFYRLATTIVIANGPTIVATFSPALIGFASPLAMSGRKIENLGTPTVATDAVTKQYVDTLAASIAPARRKVSSALNHMTIPPTPGETPIFDGDFDLGVPFNGPRSIRVIIDPIFALADQVQDIRATIIYRSNLNAFDVPLDIYKFTVAQTGFSRAPVSFAGPLAANAGIVRVTITAQLAASTPSPLSNALLHVGAGGPYGNLRSFITLEDLGP